MQSIEIRFVVLFLILYNADAKSHECAEHNNNTVVARAVKRDSEEENNREIEIKKKFEDLFEAFDENDEKRLEEIYIELEKLHIDDDEDIEDVDYKSNVIKYVVSVCKKRRISL